MKIRLDQIDSQFWHYIMMSVLKCFKMVEETFFWIIVPVCTHQIFAHNPKSSLRFLSGRIQWIVRQLCSPEELSTSKYNGDPRDSGAEILGRERKPKKGTLLKFCLSGFLQKLNIISMHLNIRYHLRSTSPSQTHDSVWSKTTLITVGVAGAGGSCKLGTFFKSPWQ